MSIFAELNKQNTETVENVSLRDIEKSFKEYAAAEHAANVLGNAATVVGHFAEEGITAIAADSINIHIDNANALTGSEITRKFSKEDFSDEATPESLKLLASQSAEDFKSTAKAAVTKTIEAIKKFIKKIWDWLTSFGRKDKEIKEDTVTLEEKVRALRKEKITEKEKSIKPNDVKKESTETYHSDYFQIDGVSDAVKSLEALHHKADKIISCVKVPDLIEIFRDPYKTKYPRYRSPSKKYDTVIAKLSNGSTVSSNNDGMIMVSSSHTRSTVRTPVLEEQVINKMLDFIKSDNCVQKINDHIKKLSKQLEYATEYLEILSKKSQNVPDTVRNTPAEDLEMISPYITNLKLPTQIRQLAIIAEDHLNTVRAVHNLIKWSEANR